MDTVKIITNNPLVIAKYKDACMIIEGDANAIFLEARKLVHLGAKLINYPLSGSIKPNQSPYKSLIISAATGIGLDYKSLQSLEAALEAVAKLPKTNLPITEAIAEDFQVIDLDLLQSALQALPAEYYF